MKMIKIITDIHFIFLFCSTFQISVLYRNINQEICFVDQ